MDIESAVMSLIAYSGNARSLAFKALDLAKKRDFDEADALLRQSEEEFNKAHRAQTDLLVAEANGEKIEMNVLLVHSQDHLMTSMLAQELIQEMIVLHKNQSLTV